MHSTLLFSLLAAEGEPPTFDPFPGSIEPFGAVVLVVLAVLLLWWLLRFQVGQAEPVEVGHHDDHGHGHAEPHQAAMHAPAPAAEAGMAAEPEPAPESTTEMEPPEPDDLKKLEGIGPKVEGVLNAAGIETFAQLAAAEVARLQSILDAAEYQYMDPASWPEQAALAAMGEWEALKKLQDELIAGKE